MDITLCPVPSDADPADIRLRIPNTGCGAPVVDTVLRARKAGIEAWFLDPPPPSQAQRYIAALIPGAQADQPYRSIALLAEMIGAWTQDQPRPQFSVRLVPPSVDPPPVRGTRGAPLSVLAWPVEDQRPQRARNLSPGIPGQSVDPPPGRMAPSVSWPVADFADPIPWTRARMSSAWQIVVTPAGERVWMLIE